MHRYPAREAAAGAATTTRTISDVKRAGLVTLRLPLARLRVKDTHRGLHAMRTREKLDRTRGPAVPAASREWDRME